MTTEQNKMPNWILIVSGIFAAMELMVSIMMFVQPQTVGDTIDLGAKGVVYLVEIWASRQFALGCILAYAALKRSIPMLTLSYIFLFVMFAGDLLIGLLQKETPLITSASVMCAISAAMLFAFHKIKK